MGTEEPLKSQTYPFAVVVGSDIMYWLKKWKIFNFGLENNGTHKVKKNEGIEYYKNIFKPYERDYQGITPWID